MAGFRPTPRFFGKTRHTSKLPWTRDSGPNRSSISSLKWAEFIEHAMYIYIYVIICIYIYLYMCIYNYRYAWAPVKILYISVVIIVDNSFFLGGKGISLSSIVCHYRFWRVPYRFTVFRAHFWKKNILQWFSTSLTVTNMYVSITKSVKTGYYQVSSSCRFM